MGEKKPLHRTGLHPESPEGKGFTIDEQNEGVTTDTC